MFYGVQKFGKWSCQDAITRLLLLVLLVPLGAASRLDRAVLALGLVNFAVLGIGLFWTRDFLRGPRAAITLSSAVPYARFGFTVFVANLLLMTVWRTGEIAIVLLSGRPSEAALFSIANAIVMSAGLLLIQVAVMMTPLFTSLHLSDRNAALESGMGYMLKYLTIAAFFAILLTYAAASPVTDRVLGPPYAAVAANLKILVVGLPAIAVIGVGLSHPSSGNSLPRRC